MILTRFRIVAVLVAATGALAGCSSSSETSSSSLGKSPSTTASASAVAPPTTAASTEGSAAAGNITVFAASALKDAFIALGPAFTKAHPESRVTFSFDASSSLAAQIAQGAPVDVFAAADMATMAKVADGGLTLSTPKAFATTPLAILTAPGNPKGIKSVEDLAAAGLKIVLCAEQVPCGTYAKSVLEKAHANLTPVSMEQNVKGVVSKVVAGEADAGIVYATDANAVGDRAAAVAIDPSINVVASFPVVALKASKKSASAQAFVDFLLSPEGQAALSAAGFGKP